jgi:hypothetical protein
MMRFISTDTTGVVQANMRYTGDQYTRAKAVLNQNVKQYSHAKGFLGNLNFSTIF